MNPNTTNNVLGHLLIRSRENNQAYQSENASLRAALSQLQNRVHDLTIWHRNMVEMSLRDAEWRNVMREGGRITTEGIDNMYDLYIEMVQAHPAIASYHDEVERVVLRAELGRAMINNEVIDLTATDDEETEDEDEVEI